MVMTANPCNIAMVLQAYCRCNVVGGLEAPPGLIKACRYCLNRYFSTSYSLVTIPNAYNNALLLKACFKVSSRGPRLTMTRFYV